NIRQTVTLSSGESDPLSNGYASGLASVSYEYSADGTTWAPIGTLGSAPFDSILWNTTGVADGIYQLRIVVSDGAGNSAPSAPVTNVRVDNTPPTTSQDDPGLYLRATKTLTGSAADSGSGVDHVDFQRAPTGSGSWTTIATDSTPGDGLQASFDTTGVADGHVDLHVVATDTAGNTTTSATVTKLVDNTKPSTTDDAPSGWQASPVTVQVSANDGGSGVNVTEYSVDGNSTYTAGTTVAI